MKCMTFMCKKYTFPGECNGRLQGLCWECPKSDSIIGYFCDRCGAEVDSPDELLDSNGQEVCSDCNKSNGTSEEEEFEWHL